jgi:hypothetical protein
MESFGLIFFFTSLAVGDSSVMVVSAAWTVGAMDSAVYYPPLLPHLLLLSFSNVIR